MIGARVSASSRLATLVAATGFIAFSATDARAADHRKVAVLEYRAGVTQEPNLGQRVADRLRKTAALVVVDPQEARRRNPRVDAEVARCAGDAECVARLGVTLDADEVLLTAVSQLGDVVLALQRIDVETVKVKNQASQVLADGGHVTDDQIEAWLHQLYPPEVFKQYGYIMVTANQTGAEIGINGQDRGETPLDEKIRVVAPRSYHVNLAKPGYSNFSAKIDVVPDATVEVRAELVPMNGPTPFYKRWYLWAILGGVVAGAAIGTAAYVTRPDLSHSSGYIVLP